MKANKKETGHKSSKIKGKGLLNKLIDKLPVEFHLPTYSYCGPGTKRVRFVRGDLPKNTLDEACRTHDIAYFDKDSNTRHQADIKLKNRAKEIYKDSNKKVSERGAAWLVNKAMAIKTNIGAGHQRQKVYKKVKKQAKCKKNTANCVTFGCGLRSIKTKISKAVQKKTNNFRDLLKVGFKSANTAFKNKNVKNIPRIIPVKRKIGNGIPLIPIFTALSAIGGLVNGFTNLYKNIKASKNAINRMNEAKKKGEIVQEVSIGHGIYLKPYKKGYGIC